MQTALIRILLMVVMLDCATAGRMFPWPVPRDFWRVCVILGLGCAPGRLTGRRRRSPYMPPDRLVALAIAAGFLVRGAVNLLACPTP